MDVEKRVIKQVSFYFSDSNLLRDKFMKQKLKENDGWIDMDCLLTFNRLKQLCDDKTKLMEYLEKSTDGFLELDHEKFSVRRHKDHPLPDMSPRDFYNNVKLQTVILKGFPRDKSINVEVIEKFCQDHNIENIVDIRLMRNGIKEFVGKVYVQLKTEKLAKSLLENKSELHFIHENTKHEISKLTVDEQRERYKKKKEEKARERFYDQIGYKNSDEPAKCGFQPGKLLHFTCPNESITREMIKEALKDTFPVKWIHFNKGDSEGIIEMANGGDAINLHKKLTNDDAQCLLNTKIKNSEEDKTTVDLTLTVIEGQAEISFWRNKLNPKKKRSTNENSRNNHNVSKKRMRNNPRNVKPEGKHTKFSEENSEDEE